MLVMSWRLSLASAAAVSLATVVQGDMKILAYDIDTIYNEHMFPSAGVVEDEMLSYENSGLVWKDSSKLLVGVVAKSENAESVLRPAFEATGFEKTGCSKYRCSGFLQIESYPDLQAREEVKFISPSLPIADQAGSIISEALQSLRVDDVRRNIDPNLDGTGLRIGIISVSYDVFVNATTTEANDIASGDLPDDVEVVKELTNLDRANDEGRAIAQLVHDLVPGAKIFFRTGLCGEDDFANGIQELADRGCDVIVDDITFRTQPFFQDGVIAHRASEVAEKQGIPYFTSAGNTGKRSWEGRFLGSGKFDEKGCELHNFGNVRNVQTRQRMDVVSPRFTLQWDDPFASVNPSFGATRNIDVRAYVGSSQQPVFEYTADNVGGDPVIDFGGTETGTLEMEISLCTMATDNELPPYIKWVFFGRRISNIQFDTQSSTSFGHKNTAFTAAVGSAFFNETTEFGVDPSRLESSSSRGGTPVFINNDGTRKPEAEIRMQPRFVATDGCRNTFFGRTLPPQPGFYFFGTSAAAPNAAAVAIILLQVNPDLTPLQIYEILENTAIDMGRPGFDFDSGYGYIDAQAAVNAVPRIIMTSPPTPIPPTSASPTRPPTYESHGIHGYRRRKKVFQQVFMSSKGSKSNKSSSGGRMPAKGSKGSKSNSRESGSLRGGYRYRPKSTFSDYYTYLSKKRMKRCADPYFC